jgi:hypothetical protein
MDQNKSIFFSTFYDKEKLRQATLLLKHAGIEFQLIDKAQANSLIGNFKAPLSVYFEFDMLISDDEFDRANEILKELIE